MCLGTTGLANHRDQEFEPLKAGKFNNDVNFAQTIVPHDEQVIDTARLQLTYGKDPEMRQLAREMITDRQSEINQMQQWLKAHDIETWAPVRCHDGHKKANNVN